MKGSIFTLFQEMVEDEFSMECWEQLIAESNLASEGIYTSTLNYDDAEIVALVSALSNYTQLSIPALLEHFGAYLFPHLYGSLPTEMTHYTDLWVFLEDVDRVIHMEVEKFDPLAKTPTIKIESQSSTTMLIHYRSDRKMCFLAIGLLKGAAEKFNETIEVSQGQCMHDNHDYCEITLTRNS